MLFFLITLINSAENVDINASKETDLIGNSDLNIASYSNVAIKKKTKFNTR